MIVATAHLLLSLDKETLRLRSNCNFKFSGSLLCLLAELFLLKTSTSNQPETKIIGWKGKFCNWFTQNESKRANSTFSSWSLDSSIQSIKDKLPCINW